MCLSYLDAGVTAAETRLRGEIAASKDIYGDAARAAFRTFWTSARRTMFADAIARARFVLWLKSRLPSNEQGKGDCFGSAADEPSVMQCFSALTPRQQTEAINH